MNDDFFKKILLTKEEKEILENLCQNKVYLRNIFQDNHTELDKLLIQGKYNANAYLQRNRLGQRLSIFDENNLYNCLLELQSKLGLKKIPRKIECYDISHLSGKYVYGSMVTFLDGKPAKKFYRLFKTTKRNDDFANHKEVLERRLRRFLKWEEDSKETPKKNPWSLPDLIIVDGGKGQLKYDQEVLYLFQEEFERKGFSPNIEICSLAKREEEVFVPSDYYPNSSERGQEGGIILEGQTKFLIQRIRDEAHRFAISNNRKARLKEVSRSELDSIKGIGPKTKESLLSYFGSVKNMLLQLHENEEIFHELIGKKSTSKLKEYFNLP